MLIAAGIFIVYLFITNMIFVVHGAIKGNSYVTIPDGVSTYQEYFSLFLQMLPFHGVVSLVKYIIGAVI
jgi:hypothetical protein